MCLQPYNIHCLLWSRQLNILILGIDGQNTMYVFASTQAIYREKQMCTYMIG